MHESVLILTLTGSLAAALALGYVTQRLKLSPIIGYLLAGLIVGPYTPGFVANRALAREFAEVGIVLLMFGVGLHFHLNDLLAVRNIAILGALTQSAITTLLGVLAGHAFQWPWSASVVFGLSLSVASTVMLTRVLVDTADLQTPAGRIAIGWLVVEDIFTVLVLVLLPAVLMPSIQQTALALVVAITIGKLVVLAVFAFVVGGWIIPRLLNSVAATGSRELFTLAVLVIALGIAVGSSMAFGVSLALGAFLAGMIVGRSEFSMRAASDALPMRDAFAVLFFVSVGMLLDPRALMKSPRVLLITLAIVLLAKPIVAFLITAVMGYESQVGIRIAVALAQIGEFSLILATVGDQLKIFPEGTTNVIVAASIISLSLNPLLYRSIGPLNGMFSRVFARQPGDSEKGREDLHKGEEARSDFLAALTGVCRATGKSMTPEGSCLTTSIPQRLDRLPWSSWHRKMVTALGITWLLDGLEVTMAGALASILKDPKALGLSNVQVGATATAYLAGAVVGALVFGWLTDRFGRKKLFFVTLGVYVAATAATAFAWNFWSFAVFRAITGLGIGGEYAAINSAIDELNPAAVRGTVDLIINATFWIGAALGSLGTLFLLDSGLLSPTFGWRFAFGIGAVLGLIILRLRRFVPESPRWLLLRGHEEQAEEIVRSIETAVAQEKGPLPEPQGSLSLRVRSYTPLREVWRAMTT